MTLISAIAQKVIGYGRGNSRFHVIGYDFDDVKIVKSYFQDFMKFCDYSEKLLYFPNFSIL